MLFLGAVNRENGTLQSLPYSGGICEQPLRTLNLFLYLQNLFVQYIQENMNKK